MTELEEFREKARRLLFDCQLNVFPVVFEMYVRTFGIKVDREHAMGRIISIIRSSEDHRTAYELVCHYLDDLENVV